MLAAAFTVAILLCSYSIIPTYVCKALWRRPRPSLPGERDIFLTFDDGPSAAYTNRLLDVLKEHQIKATFFVVAEHARQNRMVIRRMQEEGHTVALHSNCHKNALLRGKRFMKDDFRAAAQAMEELQCNVRYYRPPWGHLNLFTLYYIKKLKMKLVLWNVMAQDWKDDATVEGIGQKLLRRTKQGAIICLHDARGAAGAPARTINALEQTIPLLKQRGYRFISLEEYDGCH